ncbi:MAG: hypothetical protein M0Z84_03275 [Gammaproteobacteria bacterium]|nr:hypothetical protein [Gammaproteobacteria bacterium]
MAHSAPDLLKTLCGCAGFALLTAQGELVFPGGDAADTLTGTLGPRSRDFLRAYLRQPDLPGWRIALIHESSGPQAPDPVVLCLEAEVVRQLYPVGARATGNLTTFQQKHRCHGLWPGLALLLSQLLNIEPATPLYCPVLFDRHTFLASYPEAPGAPAAAGPVDVPVIEVLNLAAPLAVRQRGDPLILALRARLQHSLPAPDGRDTPDFTILDGLLQPRAPQTAGDAQYYGVDKRSDRNITLSARAIQQLHAADHHAPVERWLEHPHRTVNAARLQQFVHFRELDPARLDLLAERSFVYTAAAGSTLLHRGMTDPWNMYLLEGAVMLTADDAAGFVVEGGSDKANSPVAFLKPRKYTVSTLTPVSFLWIHDVLLQVLCAGIVPAPDAGMTAASGSQVSGGARSVQRHQTSGDHPITPAATERPQGDHSRHPPNNGK